MIAFDRCARIGGDRGKITVLREVRWWRGCVRGSTTNSSRPRWTIPASCLATGVTIWGRGLDITFAVMDSEAFHLARIYDALHHAADESAISAVTIPASLDSTMASTPHQPTGGGSVCTSRSSSSM